MGTRSQAMKELLRYLLVGGLNTVFGYSIIFVLMYLLSWSPQASNIAGYGAGFVFSYILHRIITFRSRNSKFPELARYLVVFGISFISNYSVLELSLRKLMLDPYVSQVVAGCIYILVSYGLNKMIVFRNRGGLSP